MLPLTWLVVMISCSYSSSHQTDRGQDGSYYLDRRIIILCRAVVSSHCYPKHKHFFSPQSLLNLLTPNTPTVFNYISPHTAIHLEYKCRSLNKPSLKSLCQVAGLFVYSSFHLATQVIRWLFCSCQAAEGVCHKTQSAHWPLAQISCFCHPN